MALILLLEDLPNYSVSIDTETYEALYPESIGKRYSYPITQIQFSDIRQVIHQHTFKTESFYGSIYIQVFDVPVEILVSLLKPILVS